MKRLLILTLGAFVWQTTEILPIGLLPQIASDLSVSESHVGLLVTGYAWLVAFSAIPLTVLTERFDRRVLVLVLLTGLTGANFLAAFVPNYPTLVILRAVVAFGHGIFWSIIASLATRLAPDIPKSRATAWAFAGIALALVGGIPCATAIGLWSGWRSAFGAGAILGGIALITAALFLPSMPARQSTAIGHGLRRQPALFHISVVTALIITAHFCGYTYVAPLLDRVAGVPAGRLPLLLLAFGVAGLTGNGLGGWLASHPSRTVLIASLGIIMSQGLITLVNPAPALAWIEMVAWGASASLLVVGLQSWVLELAPDNADTASSLYVAAFNFGIGAGALSGGITLDTVGLRAIAGIGAGIGVLALIVFFAGSRRPARFEI
ncbi:MFS transporter [Telmatospirillum sp.]|uniref:MFS transporter n=1 Tax=Telmatospirillum sp. TaxID=2079197 RepID=UPI00283BB488|nr:MFS transporter [Telmatospirillum sp.]MDR3436764.1 MFS transporter [Telmatospirillum sp.]